MTALPQSTRRKLSLLPLADECFRVAGRQTWYTAVAEIQADLDRFLAYYNHQRTQQGYRLQGRPPAAALQQALGIEALPEIGGQEPADEPPLTPAA